MTDFYDMNRALDRDNSLGAVQQGLQFGQQQRALGEQRADQQAIRGLAPGVLSGDPNALAQVAAIDPRAAADLDDAASRSGRKLKNWYDYTNRALEASRKTGDFTAVNAALRAGAPYVSRELLGGKPAPTEWNPAFESGWQQLGARVAMMDSPDATDLPAGFRERHMMLLAAGHQPGSPEYQRGMGMGTGLVAREVGAAAKTGTIRGLDGLERPWIFDPTTKAYTVFDGNAWRPMGAQEIQQVEGLPAATTTAATPPLGSPMGPPGDMFASLKAEVPGLRITDEGVRTPEQNAALPNSVPNSYHLTGQALDIGTPTPDQQARIQQWAQRNGYEVIRNYADGHWHLEPRGNAPSPQGATGQPSPNYGGLAIGRSPEAQTRLTEQAKTDVTIANAPTMATLDAEAERQKALAKATAEAQAREQFGSDESRKNAAEAQKKMPQLGAVGRGVDRIEKALESLDVYGVNTGPLDQYAVRQFPAGQELETSVGEIQNSMLALVRVPGVGSQSDLEARVAAQQYPSLDKHPEVNARTMKNLRALYEDLKAAYDNVIAGGNRSAPAAPSGAGWSVTEVK